MKVPLLDLSRQYDVLKDDLEAAIVRVARSGRYILGPEVIELEEKIADLCGVSHGVGVSSGSDALLISLMALDIGQGDEVITTPFTFFATAGAIARLGATPVFVDIEEDSFNLDQTMVEKAITDKTKAIVTVHLFGQTAKMDELKKLIKDRDIKLVEDAAQAIGAKDPKLGMAGSVGDLGCFSFFPSKNLGAMGDGGMVVTDNDELANKLRVLRAHGSSPKYYHALIGGNFRLDPMQAAVLKVKLGYLDSWHEKRAENAKTYTKLFDKRKKQLANYIKTPAKPYGRHVYNQYVIRAERRDELREFLSSKEIGAEIYYPKTLHLQDCFKYLDYKEGDFPVAEKAATEVLALPIFAELRREEIEYVVDSIEEFYK